MNNLTINHSADTLKRMDNTIFHQTDAKKRKETRLTHSTDVYKRGSLTAAHTTNAFLEKFSAVSHQTDANKLKNPFLIHRTDAFLTLPGGIGGTALGTHTQLDLESAAKFSKNSPLFIDIGSGLSTRIGMSRISTWNTLGRPENPKKGAVGFNTETKMLEIWNGTTWHSIYLEKA